MPVWNFHTPVWILWKSVFSLQHSVLLRCCAYKLPRSFFFIEATPSGIRRVVDRVVSSFSTYCRSFFTLTRARIYECDCLCAPPNNEFFWHNGGWHAPTSLIPSLDLALSKKLHTMLDHDLILVFSSPFWLHNPKCIKEHKNICFNDKI